MKEIPKKFIDDVLNPLYKPEYHLLKSAEEEYPIAQGTFKLPSSFYTQKSMNHLTAIEAQFCLNQLAYISFAEWIQKNKINALDISFEKYLEMMFNKMLIIKSNIQFKKIIETDKEISGQIKVKSIRKHGNLYLAFLDYDIENGSSIGELELALKLN